MTQRRLSRSSPRSRSSSKPTVNIPTWLVTILVSTFLAMLGTVFYAGQTYGKVEDQEKRLTRIEDGVEQLWQRAVYGPVAPSR